MPHLNIGIITSHTGTNFQAILDACNQGASALPAVLSSATTPAQSPSVEREGKAFRGSISAQKPTRLPQIWTSPLQTPWQSTRWT